MVYKIEEKEVLITMRIKEHPIISNEQKKKIRFFFEDEEMWAYEGESIAAALVANGVSVFRYTSKEQQPRSYYCANGMCANCVMVVNGKAGVKTCITDVEEGMNVRIQYGLSERKDNDKI